MIWKMNCLRVYGRFLLLDVLAMLFGISSWISINGLWVELPLLVFRLPESWAIASYLSVIVQLANLGPLAYSFVRWVNNGPSLDKYCIYLLLSVGTVSSIILAMYWDVTGNIAGSEHSVALFGLVFFLSLVDCTSSILFLPFMAVFRDIYLNSYLIGEGLSGLIPSLAALAQGVGGNPSCQNITQFNNVTNKTETKEISVFPEPRFSVDNFFEFLASMMAVSTLAFILLNHLPQMKEEHASQHHFVATEDNLGEAAPGPEGRDEERYPPYLSRQQRNMALTQEQKYQAKLDFMILMIIQAIICFLSNGALPSIQTYSCLPYGNLIYHLSVTLHAMANPIMAFAAFFVSVREVKHIIALTCTGMVFVIYILATAFHSPEMLFGSYGGVLTVLSWVVYGGIFSYIKVSIAGKCRQISAKALFWCGAVTQIGSALGALLMFIMVNYGKVFQQYTLHCRDDPKW